MELEDLYMRNYLKHFEAVMLVKSSEAAAKQEIKRKRQLETRARLRGASKQAEEACGKEKLEIEQMRLEDVQSAKLRKYYQGLEARQARFDVATKTFTPYFDDSDNMRVLGGQWTQPGTATESQFLSILSLPLSFLSPLSIYRFIAQ